MKKSEAGAKTYQRDIRKKNNLLSYKKPSPRPSDATHTTTGFHHTSPTTHTTTGFQHTLRLHL